MQANQGLWRKLMPILLTLLLVGSILVTACGGKEKATQPKPTATTTTHDPLTKILPSIVKVTAQTSEGISEGTGFVIDSKKAYVFTATHVVANAGAKNVHIIDRTGTSHEVTMVASYGAVDISLLSSGGYPYAPAISFGSLPALGQELFIIGMVDDSYTSISGPVREIQQDNAGNTIVTIEAQAEPGMSGGPVVDQYGNGIGILSMGSVNNDVNAAIAIALSKENVDDMIAFAEGRRTATPTPAATPKPTTMEVPLCLFQGTVQFNNSNVPDGTEVWLTIEGHTYLTHTTNSTYDIQIAEPKDENYTGKKVTFKISIYTVASYTAAQTATWNNGDVVNVNLSNR